MNTNKFSKDLSIHEVSRILAQYWRLSAACFSASVVLALIALLIFPRSYRSESQLYVRLGRDSASLDAAATIGRTSLPSSLPSTREEEMNTITEILSSRALAEQVVDVVGPQSILHDLDLTETESSHPSAVAVVHATAVSLITPVSEVVASVSLPAEAAVSDSGREAAVIKLQRMVQVQPVKKSDVVHVDCESGNPRLAQKIVACLVDCYLAAHLRLNSTSGAHEFFQQQADQMRSSLTQTEDQLHQLKDQTGLAAPEMQRDLLVSRASRLEDELLAATAQLTSTQAQAEALRQKVASLPETKITSDTTGVESHGVELMRDELYRLQMAVQEMESKYTDEHVLLKQARERLAAAKKSFEAAPPAREVVTSGPNTVYEKTQAELLELEPVLTSLRAKVDKLQTQLAEAKEKVKTFTAAEMQLADLNRDLRQRETDYLAYAEHLEQTRIDQALEADRISNISIIQPATFESTPIKAKSHLVAGLLLVMGLASAIGLPLLLESRKRYASEAQLANHHSATTLVAPITRRMSEQFSGNPT